MDFVKHFPICVVLFGEKTDNINCNMFEYTAHWFGFTFKHYISINTREKNTPGRSWFVFASNVIIALSLII